MVLVGWEILNFYREKEKKREIANWENKQCHLSYNACENCHDIAFWIFDFACSLWLVCFFG